MCPRHERRCRRTARAPAQRSPYINRLHANYVQRSRHFTRYLMRLLKKNNFT